MCGWNDEGLGAWAYSDLNGQTLVEAQHEFLSEGARVGGGVRSVMSSATPRGVRTS